MIDFLVAETQDGKTLDNEIEVVEGMKFDRGYISPYFVTDNKTQMCEMENPIILIVEKKVRAVACTIGVSPPKRKVVLPPMLFGP